MAATGKEGGGKREADGDGEKGLHGIRDGLYIIFNVHLEWMCVWDQKPLLFEVVLLIQSFCGSLFFSGSKENYVLASFQPQIS